MSFYLEIHFFIKFPPRISMISGLTCLCGEHSIPTGCPEQSCSSIAAQDSSECDWEGRAEQQQQSGVLHPLC